MRGDSWKKLRSMVKAKGMCLNFCPCIYSVDVCERKSIIDRKFGKGENVIIILLFTLQNSL